MFIAALTVGEMFSTGGITALIGMGMTFIVLALLIFFLDAMEKGNKLDFSKIFGKKKSVPKDSALTPNVTPHEEVFSHDKTSNEEDKIAAIMAAISVVMRQETSSANKSKASFIVKSIKRV